MDLARALTRFATKLLQFALMIPSHATQLVWDVYRACVSGAVAAAAAVMICFFLGLDISLGVMWGPPVALVVFAREFHKHFIKGEGMGFNDAY